MFEPESFVQGTHFGQIIQLFCRVLSYIYEQEMAKNVLLFILTLIQAVPMNLSAQSKHKVLESYIHI